MSSLAVFKFESKSVRTIVINGELWFVAKDVCDILEIKNVSDSLSRLDDDEKGIALIDTPGGKQDMTIVSESGLYALIVTSRKPEAKPFRKWVTSEVLPSIRKTGSYAIAPKPVSLIDIVESQVALFKEQAAKIAEIEAKLALEAQRNDAIEETLRQHDAELDRVFNPDGDYFTVRGYAKLKGFKLDITQAKAYGRTASHLSRQNGFRVDKIKDPRYGMVNAYSEHILNQLSW